MSKVRTPADTFGPGRVRTPADTFGDQGGNGWSRPSPTPGHFPNANRPLAPVPGVNPASPNGGK